MTKNSNFDQDYRGRLLNLINQLPIIETQWAITKFLNNAQQVTNKITYSSDGIRDFSLVINFSSKGDKVINIVINGRSDEILHQLEQELISIIYNKPVKYGHLLLMSSLPINGYYRYEDEFQIIPVPDLLSSFDTSWVANNPFILEFKYTGSDNAMVNLIRFQQTAKEITCLLNIVLKGGVSCLQNHSSRVWVIEYENGVGKNKCLQNGYILKKYDEPVSGFSEVDGVQPMLISNFYYESYGYDVGEQMTIPSFANATFESFYHIVDKEAKNVFLTSSYWYESACKSVTASQSAVNLFIAMSIEALAKGEDMELEEVFCQHCSLVTGKREPKKKNFVKLLNKYIPDTIPEKIKGDFYREIRSKIAHGGLLEKDKFLPGIFYPKANNENNITRQFLEINKVMLTNWLLSRRNS